MNGRKIKNITAFTLVELIVVISILAILGTIGFLSFQSYGVSSRDSVRLGDIKMIAKSLELEHTKNNILPLPDDNVEITGSGEILLYQGYAGQGVLGKISVFGGQDPLDNEYYTYAIDKTGHKYQVLGFMEGYEYTSIGIFGNTFADKNHRHIESKGENLGIILDAITYEPIQNTGTGIDVLSAGDNYIAVFGGENNGVLTFNSNNRRSYINPIESCNTILQRGNSNGDGMYTINPTGTSDFRVYCDMTTDGGGWTLLAHADGESILVYDYNDIITWNVKNSDNCNPQTECLSESGKELLNWDDLMVYTRGYKVKGVQCNDKRLSIKGYSQLPYNLPTSSSNWLSQGYGAHGKCDHLLEVSQGESISNLSTNSSWPIRMGVQFTSNDNINEHALLFYGPTFVPQGLGTRRNLATGKIKNHYGSDTVSQAELWHGASTQKQTWFIR